MRKSRAVAISLLSMTAAFSAGTLSAPTAKADYCEYPAVGVAADVIAGRGAYCNYPTEINGSHLHCEGGSFGIGGGDTGGLSIAALGVGGASCTWRCPDNTPAPAPNPPGAWQSYMIPQPNACADHMEPAGPLSEPVRPDEGVPPEGTPHLPGPVEVPGTPQTELADKPPVARGEPEPLAPQEPNP